MKLDVQVEYERWRTQLGEHGPSSPHAVGAEVVLRAHFLVVDFFSDFERGIGGVGPRSLHLLHSAIGRQHVGMGSTRKWKDLAEVTATLFYGIIKDHPFHDANKRTALLVMLHQLDLGGRTSSVPQKELDTLAVRVAGNQLADYPAYDGFESREDGDVRFIARQIRRMTRAIDVRHYYITYRELDALLHRFDARLEPCGANQANLFRTVDEPTGLLGLKRKKVERRVAQIGFNDWGTQVPPAEIKRVREVLELLPQNGVDSQVFFKDVDSIVALVREYAGPLRRLANK